MEFTACQKEALFQQYDKLVWQVVHRFSRRMHGGYHNKEDLHSECWVVLYQYLSACQTPEEMQKTPIRDMINAMCVYTLGEQAVSYPKRTTNFKAVIDSANGKADVLEGHVDDASTRDPIGDAIDRIAFNEYVSTLSPTEQRIVSMKLGAYRNREIAKALGLSDVEMTRTLQRILKRYTAQQAA